VFSSWWACAYRWNPSERWRSGSGADRKQAELWARGLAFTGNPRLASRMTVDSGFMHVPVPADAEHPTPDLWVVGDVSAADLVAFYIRFMAAAGWVLDQRASTPEPTDLYGATCTALCFGLPDPVRWITIRVWTTNGLQPIRRSSCK
jgi:hypothetical protein